MKRLATSVNYAKFCILSELPPWQHRRHFLLTHINQWNVEWKRSVLGASARHELQHRLQRPGGSEHVCKRVGVTYCEVTRSNCGQNSAEIDVKKHVGLFTKFGLTMQATVFIKSYYIIFQILLLFSERRRHGMPFCSSRRDLLGNVSSRQIHQNDIRGSIFKAPPLPKPAQIPFYATPWSIHRPYNQQSLNVRSAVPLFEAGSTTAQFLRFDGVTNFNNVAIHNNPFLSNRWWHFNKLTSNLEPMLWAQYVGSDQQVGGKSRRRMVRMMTHRSSNLSSEPRHLSIIIDLE